MDNDAVMDVDDDAVVHMHYHAVADVHRVVQHIGGKEGVGDSHQLLGGAEGVVVAAGGVDLRVEEPRAVGPIDTVLHHAVDQGGALPHHDGEEARGVGRRGVQFGIALAAEGRTLQQGNAHGDLAVGYRCPLCVAHHSLVGETLRNILGADGGER